ncbi:MAG: hypothetical protein Q8Q09_12920 [Deltaproteobacteria bacterium]|nr:hypothetical protein [Deltaproteobacteria bacterium]
MINAQTLRTLSALAESYERERDHAAETLAECRRVSLRRQQELSHAQTTLTRTQSDLQHATEARRALATKVTDAVELQWAHQHRLRLQDLCNAAIADVEAALRAHDEARRHADNAFNQLALVEAKIKAVVSRRERLVAEDARKVAEREDEEASERAARRKH